MLKSDFLLGMRAAAIAAGYGVLIVLMIRLFSRSGSTPLSVWVMAVAVSVVALGQWINRYAAKMNRYQVSLVEAAASYMAGVRQAERGWAAINEESTKAAAKLDIAAGADATTDARNAGIRALEAIEAFEAFDAEERKRSPRI